MAIQSGAIRVGAAVIDGWDWNWLEEVDKQEVLEWLDDRSLRITVPEERRKTFVNRLKTLRKGRQVGIVGKWGEIEWVDWWKVQLDGLELDMNLKRVLQRCWI